jgi:hypothetical protein
MTRSPMTQGMTPKQHLRHIVVPMRHNEDLAREVHNYAHSRTDMVQWCEEHVGPRVLTKGGVIDPNGMWEAFTEGFRFHHPDDAFAFKMRWG